jgi:hypothetical protein
MQISQQHQARGFGNLVIAASIKPSRVTAFEDASDDEDMSEGPQYRRPVIVKPVKPIPQIKKEEETVPKI